MPAGTIATTSSIGNRPSRLGCVVPLYQELRKMVSIYEKLDRDAAKLVKNAEQLEDQLARRPISTPSLTYDPASGFSWEPQTIRTTYFSFGIPGSSMMPPSNAEKFSPSEYATSDSVIRPLGGMVTRYATFVAFELRNQTPEFRFKVDWVKRDRRSSSIVLLDADTGAYYYPVESTLSGDVVVGFPKIGIIAFEPFRSPCSSVRVQLTEVQLQMGRGGRQTCNFQFASKSLRQIIEGELANPPIHEAVRDLIARELPKAKSRLTRGALGCPVILLIAVAAILISLNLQ
jgi:hypothetical protein